MKTTTIISCLMLMTLLACKQESPKHAGVTRDSDTNQIAAATTQGETEGPKPYVIGDRRIIRIAAGDLNKDGRVDSVLVYENAADSTMEDERSRYIEVYFAGDGGYKKVAASDKAVQGYMPSNGADISMLEIKNGILTIGEELIAGHYENKFRYQNNNFELIGHEDVESDRHGSMETVSYNLSTGKLEYEKARYDTDKVLKKVSTDYKLDTIPALETFEPFTVYIKINGIEIYL